MQQNDIYTVLDAFVLYLRDIKHFSLATIEAYSSDMCSFIEWAEELEIDVLNIENKDIRMFVAQMLDGDCCPSTINRMLSSIRGFYKYALSNNLLKEDPSVGIKNLKIPNKVKNFMFAEQMKSFCELPKKKDVLWTARDFALFTSLYSTGARVSELTSLNMQDLSSNLSSAVVMGKGKREREIFFTSFAKDALKRYFPERELLLQKRGKLKNNAEDAVFLNLMGTRLSIYGVNYIIKRYNLISGSTKKLSPHSFRHSFATALITKGADIRVVQTLLGHENISTTQVYTHVTSKNLYELYKKAHPHS